MPRRSFIPVFVLLLACGAPQTTDDATTPGPSNTSEALTFVETPELSPNTHGAFLVWWITAKTDAPSKLQVVLTADDENLVIDFDDYQTEHNQMILGLHPDTTYDVVIRAETEAGVSAESSVLELQTQPLPEQIAGVLDVSVSKPESMEPGYMMTRINGYNIALDTTGQVVWYMPGANGGVFGRTAHAPLLLFTSKDHLYEADMAGRLLRAYCPQDLDCDAEEPIIDLDIATFHHDLIPLPNGNYASLSVERTMVPNFPTSDSDPEAPTQDAWVASDVVVEFDRNGTVVHRHSLISVLDPTRIGYSVLDSVFWRSFFDEPAYDWGHGNALWFDPLREEFVVSLRHQDAIVGISRDTGALSWVIAPPANWNTETHGDDVLTPAVPDPFIWSYHQHAASVTPMGTVMAFDNGNGRASAFEREILNANNYSRAVEYAIDHQAGTVERVWSFGEDMVPQHLSLGKGDVDYLPQTGNAQILFTSGWDNTIPTLRLVEVTRETPAEVVFDMTVRPPSSDGYRVHRMLSLYP